MIKMLAKSVLMTAALAALVFAWAWTFDYWQAWVFISEFLALMLALGVVLKRANPKLLERRLQSGARSEMRPIQRVLHFIMSRAMIVAVGLSAVDHRCRWSVVPAGWVVAGEVLIAAGFVVTMWVFRENAFALATVEIQEGQRTIRTGPYAVVRHPMYAGVLVVFLGMPLALGSWWGLVVLALVVPVLALRIRDEEKLLAGQLAGYADYLTEVKYRLTPGIW